MNNTVLKIFKSSNNGITLSKQDITTYLDSKKTQTTKTYSKKLNFTCTYPAKTKINSDFGINCKIKNHGNKNLKDLEICLEDKCETTDLSIFQEKHFNFNHSVESVGSNPISFTVKNPDVNLMKLYSVLGVDNPNLEIDNLEFPGKVKFEDQFDIEFEIVKDSYTNPEDIEIEFRLNDLKQVWTVDELDRKRGFQIELEGKLLYLNQNRGTINIKYRDNNDNVYEETKSFEILLEEPTFWQKIQIYLTKISNWLTSE